MNYLSQVMWGLRTRKSLSILNVGGLSVCVAAAQDKEQVVRYLDRQFAEERYCYAEPAFFQLFNFPVVKGEKTGQLTRPNTVVISESAAHRYFDGLDSVGKLLTFNTASSRQDFEVTGVMADDPPASDAYIEI